MKKSEDRKIEVNEKAGFVGVYQFTKAKLEKPEHFRLSALIAKLRDEGKDVTDMIRTLNNICNTEKIIVFNIIPTVGRSTIAENMSSATPTNGVLVNKVELGSGTNVPANTDTALQTPVYRNNVASRTNANNVAYLTGFFAATEAVGTHKEAGLYVDGTTTLGDGVLMSRVAINIIKSSSETLTLDWTVTIT